MTHKKGLLGTIATAGAIILGTIGLNYQKEEPEIPPITTTIQDNTTQAPIETEQTTLEQTTEEQTTKAVPQPTVVQKPKPEFPELVSAYRATNYSNSPKLEEMLDYLKQKRQQAINSGGRYAGNRTLDSWPEQDWKTISTNESTFGKDYKKWMNPTKQAFIDLYYNGTFEQFAHLIQTLEGEIKLTELWHRASGLERKDLARITEDFPKHDYLLQNGKEPNTLPWPVIINLILTGENVDVNKTALFQGLEGTYDFATKTWLTPPTLESALDSLTRRIDAYSNLHFREKIDPQEGDIRKLYSPTLIEEYMDAAKAYLEEISRSNTIDYNALQERMNKFFNEMKHNIGETEGFQQKMLGIISQFPEDTPELCKAKYIAISPLCKHANINAIYVRLEGKIQK